MPGATASIKSYAAVPKSTEKLQIPPHLRGRQEPGPTSPGSPHSVGTQTGNVEKEDAHDIQKSVALKPVDAASVMDPEEDGIGLGPHDPQPREYRAGPSRR